MILRRTLFIPLLLASLLAGRAETYEVGPGKTLSAIGQVPWESLQPGDTVLIHARDEPYREKFAICRAGTADAPITVRGVTNSSGQLPVIDGENATTRKALNFWGDVRGVIKIGGARNPADTMPRHIVIENLDVRGGRKPATFTAANGRKLTYQRNAAAIYVEKCEHLIIRNCRLHDCGNGLFVSSNDERASRDILVEGNYIFDNGNPGSGLEHNVYTEAIGIVFQFNRFGPLRANSPGNNLKDRSAGLIVRYNWIEGGNQLLDLVDGEDSKLVRHDPRYRETFVYGNVFLKLARDARPFLVHYGGDSWNSAAYRKGTLYFYNNTIVSYRPANVLFRLSSDDEHCDFRNNLVHVAARRPSLSLLERKGILDLSHNSFDPGWGKTTLKNAAASVRDDGTSLTERTPGFVDADAQDFHIVATSICLNRGAVLPQPAVEYEYVKHQSSKPRKNDNYPDIGAYEFVFTGGR